jgi:hypothetical protein
VTIPTNSTQTELGIAWLEVLIGAEGVSVMEKNGQPAIVPATSNDASKLPEQLKKYVK